MILRTLIVKRALINFGAFSFLVCTLSGTLSSPLAATTNTPDPTQTSCPTKLEDFAPGPWTKQEKWAWNKNICLGKIADLSDQPKGASDNCNIANAEKWPDDRILTQKFIETVLFNKSYRSAYGRYGLRIECAKFLEKINIDNGAFDKEIWLDSSYFQKGMTAIGFRTAKNLTFDGSRFDAPLDAYRIIVDGDLYIREKAKLRDIYFNNAQISGNFDLSTSQIDGVFFLSRAQVKGDLILNSASISQKTDLIGTNISGDIVAIESTFQGDFNANDLNVDGNILIRDQSNFSSAKFFGAKIGGNFEILNSTFTGSIAADGINIGGSLFIRDNSSLNNISISNAKIINSIDAVETLFNGNITAQNVSVGQNFFLKSNDRFNRVDILGADIGGELNATATFFDGDFIAEQINVRGNAFFGRGAKFKNIYFNGSTIHGDLDLRRSQFKGELNLTGTKVLGQLTLASAFSKNMWLDGSMLVLKNTKIGALQDSKSAWNNLKGRLDLSGFKIPNGSSLEGRPAEWLIGWINKQHIDSRYRPQPYQQLSDTLRSHGYIDKSDEILIESNNHYRRAPTTPWTKKMLLSVEWIAFGYGYRSWQSLIWIALLIGAGVYASSKTKGVLSRASFGQRFWLSVDLLIPVLTLNEKHKNIPITGWPRWYFYIHPILGFIFVSFFITGVTGLAK